ncbi:transglutaminase-like domain-containing protein [Clostridium sp. C2-6-12]|uniref:transglutaminase domain-containing protein n=1 Tax=Clostridium sp. C2-6-12 TaxID=2698832 RepID=UPI00136AA617|nr:transglutaminase-like domain-containing protein [Clostridium sp. C2-6-12]
MKKFIRNLLIILTVALTVGVQPVFAKEDDFDTYVYNHLENWDNEFEISYYDSDVIDKIRNISKKDDYLEISINRITYEKVGRSATVKITYKTTKEQEKYINTELTRVVNSIISPSMSEYDKVSAINKYLVDRFEYDKSLKSNNPYTALTTGISTCQGYAMAAYKMFNLIGMENKIIVGEINGVPHGWNLVKLNGKWYHLDVTNNDVLRKNTFLLKNDNTLKDYGFTWDSNNYPVCNENFVEDSSKDTEVNSYNANQVYAGYKSNVDGKWELKNQSWYFINNSNDYVTGWKLIDNKWYFLSNDGKMQTGWINNYGKLYYCYPGSGFMATNTTIDKYKVDSSGAWVQ